MTEVPQTEEFSPHQKSGKAVAGTRALKRTLEEANNDSQELYTKDRLKPVTIYLFGVHSTNILD